MISRPLTTAVALALALPAFAASAASDPATELDEVLVTATRTEIALRDSLSPAQVIGRAEIERSQATSLQQLLSGRAGINPVSYTHLDVYKRQRIANAANLAALVYHGLPELNWVGFYFFDGRELVVGPFQGLPACVRIPLDKGVCGAAARTRTTQRVADVHAFPGHIACDSASRSELVVPLLRDGDLLGVFDLDSPQPARFDADDQRGLEAIAAAFVESLA